MMAESNAEAKSFNTFTQKAIDAAPSLKKPTKINLSFISQAFKLRKDLSFSTFMAFIILFFWISVIALILISGAYGILGQKLMNWISELQKIPGSPGKISMATSFAMDVVFYTCGVLVSLFGIGFAWRFHVGQKKKFLATIPSYSLFFRILWPLLLCTIFFTAIYLALSMLINLGIVKSYMHFMAGSASPKSIYFIGYIIQVFSVIEAICYWLIQSFILYLLFRRYKQDKSGEAIVPFFKSFCVNFKPFFKQCLRFFVTIAIFYFIIIFPLYVIKSSVNGMSDNVIRTVMMVVSIIYLSLVPWIITTFFNLNFLMFNSIENYKSGPKLTKEQRKAQKAEARALKSVSKSKSEAKPKAKNSKSTNKKPAGSTTAPKTASKKKPVSKVHAKLKKSSSKK
jgi:hypothetical protein